MYFCNFANAWMDCWNDCDECKFHPDNQDIKENDKDDKELVVSR